MKFKLYIALVLLFTSAINMQAYAEDIELYVNKDANSDEKPRVLLIFDTSGSMAFSSSTGDDCGQKYYNGPYILCSDSRLEAAQEAMSKVVDDNKDSIDFGLMRFNGTDGGYVLNGIGSPASDIDASIASLPASGGTPLAETLWEAYLYITGKELDYALLVDRDKRDTGIESAIITQEQVQRCEDVPYKYWSRWYGRWVWGTKKECTSVLEDVVSSYSYISPFADSAAEAKRCDNSVNIIYMTDGDPSPKYNGYYLSSSSDNDSDGSISTEHNKLFGRELTIQDYIGRELDKDDFRYDNYLHQLAKIIHGTDDTVVDLYPSTPEINETGRLYTIGFGSGMSTEGQYLLKRAAELGGGENLPASTPDELSQSLNNAVAAIRQENSTFTSPSVASNNVDQTRSRDAIYLGMFYPEKHTRWRGNLKKLKLSGNKVIDSKDIEAFDSDGLIKTSAHTFWSPDGTSDGSSVKEGGVNAALISSDKARKILTNANTNTLLDFNFNKIKNAYGNKQKAAVAFDVDKSDLKNIINWARGYDNKQNSESDALRDDIFGDPLHSKPVAIDYGNGDIRILIGTNAGFLHMFKDDDTNNKVSESWAFIPSELYKIIEPLRDEHSTKEYGIDGPISVYFNNKSLNGEGLNDGTINATKGDQVWAAVGMRRGGRNYYGLDITKPDSPSLMWTIKGGEGKFKNLGQTWSKPQVAYIKSKGNTPLLIFGAGYDTNKDSNDADNANVKTEDEVGRGIYIVNAKTGEKVWILAPKGDASKDAEFKGKYSIAADVTLLDSNYDGYTDRIYAADTGGGIWRIDISDEGKFSHFQLADLGIHADRRFFYKPVVARTMFSKVTIKDGVVTRLDTPYDAIVIGSGNRSNPNGEGTADELFMIRDENTVTKLFESAPKAITHSMLMEMNDDEFGSALNSVTEFVKLEDELANDFVGWRYKLATGEKSLAAATVVGGVAYFTSFTPTLDSSIKNQCSLSGGGGSLYAFHLHYGTKVYDDLKFATSTEVPDTPQLYFGSSCADSDDNGKCDDDPDEEVKSQFYLIGPGIKGENAENPLQPLEITGPGLKVVDDKIQLVNDKALGFGFKTQQTYIYKREENDENIQNEDD
ncbi:PilC/PilY family type IV pilus protein [Pseudoalteromonas distincta]|uniref:PilC/PilY family type IV pilus protein n=1 Tax=Pseudoalteromonas distincta TaxID=77608 RepID=A0ABT9GHW6_9GAMM|nr:MULTISPECIES: PilC/PilY family type IV pilus protein [Pseudoalteromonas distincta group]MDP4485460.1 PilC/PilY family type IV pilus protein [Pseudoalteromonas elyakovii]